MWRRSSVTSAAASRTSRFRSTSPWGRSPCRETPPARCSRRSCASRPSGASRCVSGSTERESRMPSVQTVQGPVDADELGVVLAHEHVRFRDEAVAAEWPGRYDEQAELDAALEAVNAAKSRGVQSIVDATAMFGGRDVRFMKRVSDRSEEDTSE